MIYKLQTGGIIKLQNAGSLPKWMQKLNLWSIPDSDESAGERILNSTIKQANDAATQEERDQIYKDSAKKNLAVTGQSLMMIPMLNEFATYGLLGGGLRLGAGIAGSKAGEYVLGKGGDWLDKQLHTKFLGTTGRIIGGLGGWWGGSSATTPLFRNLAGKGITLHIPQETFMNLRSQYFTNAGNKALVNLNSKPNPTLTSTINHLYKEHPELSSIGPKEAYRQYYETIFPASKVQTPYAHGTKSDLSGGLEASTKVPNAAAPETIGRNDFYLNLQPETSLQYADGIGVPKGFTWNKHRFWPLKEILGKPYESDAWMSKPIKLREQIPNRAGQFSRVKNADGTYSGHGKLLEEYKAELGMQDLSNEEFLQRFGVQNEESFNQWVAKNRQIFSDIYDSGDYHGLYHVKIDARKPLTIKGGNTYYSERGIWDRMNKGGNDVLLHNNAANEFGSDVAVVRDVTPQKVRILGSKPDQQGFTDFMGGRQQFFTEIPISPQEAATTYHFDGRMPLTRPISFEERLGWTKGERNQPVKQSIKSNPRYFLDSEELFPRDLVEIVSDDALVPNAYKQYMLSHKSDKHRGFDIYGWLEEPPTDHEIVINNINDFAKTLPDYDPRFAREDGNPSFYITQFRDYLSSLGYDTSDISDESVLKLLTHQYKDLSSGATGKLKGRLVFHGTDKPFESFDYHFTGKNTGNMGYNGAGNYFTTHPSAYGSKTISGFFGPKYRPGWQQPYMITGIKATPLNNGKLSPKLNIPDYISPHGGDYKSVIDRAIGMADTGAVKDMAVIDDISHYPIQLFTEEVPISEFSVARNTGIKSLFPHPSRFIRNADGTVSLIPTDWSDIRVNYKKGGKI